MKFTLSWLKHYLDTTASIDEIAKTLTDIGLEVEDITDPAATFAPFKVALIESAEQHPDADKLKVCMVKTDKGTLQVVCGAPNARAGMKGIFAPEKTYIPGLDVTLKKTKIRGVESNGMMASEKELCLSDEHNGIIEVDDSFAIGTPMADVYGLNDPIIEIGLTPNRADCTGIYGIARDLAAAGLGTLKPIEANAPKGTFPSPVSVSIEDEGCAQFYGRTIKNIKNGPSPDWLQNLLKAVGLRPISALVDITNFISQAYGRPLHVYDIAKLKGNITVREAQKGQTFDALNDKSYETLGGEIAITDESGLIGLGGIVGGVSTGCDETTADVFIEAAYFDPMRIARTGRDHGIISDARYRFERGVDPEFTATGLDLATQMVLDLCATDTTETSEITSAGATPEWKRTISYSPEMMTTLIGIDVDHARQKEILEALGFTIKAADNWEITPPSWRGDIFGAADITEEIFRIIGFDHLPSISVTAGSILSTPAETPLLSKIRQARTALAARGLDECVTWSFMQGPTATLFGANDNAALTLSNPISSDLEHMRPSILPNLIEAAARNHDRGYPNAALFEVGPVFHGTSPEAQPYHAAGIRFGQNHARHWAPESPVRSVDLYDAKADMIAALEACGAPATTAQITRDVPDYYHPGRAGALRLGKNVLAYFGELHPAVLEAMDIKAPVVGFEIILGNIPQSRKKGTEKPHLTLNPLQPLTRDFAFIVDQAVSSDDILKAAKAADKKLITQASVFDIYQGKGMEEGKKSVAFSITLQPHEQTLTDEEIEAVSQSVIKLVSDKTGGVLRGSVY